MRIVFVQACHWRLFDIRISFLRRRPAYCAKTRAQPHVVQHVACRAAIKLDHRLRNEFRRVWAILAPAWRDPNSDLIVSRSRTAASYWPLHVVHVAIARAHLRLSDTMPDVDSATLDALRHVSTAKLTTQLFSAGCVTSSCNKQLGKWRARRPHNRRNSACCDVCSASAFLRTDPLNQQSDSMPRNLFAADVAPQRIIAP